MSMTDTVPIFKLQAYFCGAKFSLLDTMEHDYTKQQRLEFNGASISKHFWHFGNLNKTDKTSKTKHRNIAFWHIKSLTFFPYDNDDI